MFSAILPLVAQRINHRLRLSEGFITELNRLLESLATMQQIWLNQGAFPKLTKKIKKFFDPSVHKKAKRHHLGKAKSELLLANNLLPEIYMRAVIESVAEITIRCIWGRYGDKVLKLIDLQIFVANDFDNELANIDELLSEIRTMEGRNEAA